MSGMYHAKAAIKSEWPADYVREELQIYLMHQIEPLIVDGREWSVTYYPSEVTSKKITGRVLCVLCKLIHVEIGEYVRMEAIDSALKTKEVYVPGRAYAYIFERHEGVGWLRIK